jgi:type IV secretion system protein VirD4
MLLSALKVEGGLESLLLEMTEYDHGRQAVNDMVNSGAQNMRNRAAQERSGVQSSSQIDLTLYRDPIVAKNISESDFYLDDLQNATEPVAVYLIVPPNDIDRLRPLLRVFWNLLLRRLMQTYDQSGNATHKRQLLLMFDEFTSVKKLEIFEQSMAYMGGYGIKAYLVVQSLMQLQEVYGRENAIFGLCKIKAAYAPGDYGTAEIFSQLTGKTTVVSAKHERNRKVLQLVGGNVSDRIEATGRQLLTPDEVMHLKPAKKARDGKRIKKAGEMLTLVTGYPPIRGWQPLYFKNRTLVARANIAPPDADAARAAKTAATPIAEAPVAAPSTPNFADRIRAAAQATPGDY